jgi:hypothetical protein
MDEIRDYILNIAVYIILTGFLTIILPNNSYRKYIGFVMGIIFVAMVIEPLKRGLK